MASVTCKKLPVDESYRLRGESLLTQIEIDKKNGLIPFFVIKFLFFYVASYFIKRVLNLKVCATLGTTSICSFDALEEIGPICNF